MTLLSFVDESQGAPAPELQSACRTVIGVPAPRRSRADRLPALFSADPDLARRLWSPAFEEALAALLRERSFDWVHIEGLEMAPYLRALRQAASPQRILYDAHNAEHVIQQRALQTDARLPARWPAALYSWLQLPRLRRFEAETCRAAEAVTCVSPEDARALRELAPGLSVEVIPNGIDVGEFHPARSTEAEAADGHRLVFTGKMDYRPNIDAALWFATHILPRVRARQPEARFVVVGQKPPGSLTRLHGRNGVIVTGAVEDARPHIAGAAVYVAPLRMGGGTRFKLLEAMALARPIVSTTIGAEGFPVESGRELVLADTPEAFAQSVLELLSNRQRARALGMAGRQFVQGYDWSAIVPRLEQVYARFSVPG